MSRSIPIMLRIGAVMTPIIVSEGLSYKELFEIVSRHVGTEEDAYKQSLDGFSVLWERTSPSSPFPERTLVSEKNLQATLELMILRHGRDVLEADRMVKNTSSSGVFG
ncbi:hypothetical protein AFCA_011063 [Aspergillus flavus]|uniref:Uncharacterized protein n=2 Tax=Aspergillus subgen. Circumdati TaxID=2720871 RepID=A0A5N6VYF3_9EURO|nr:hypothetical protein BDV41DRAFT_536806 [Aspergillus transmontanensis]KAE8332991.1 hypothetical protein BDV39DRAFT_166139 [Aspergillus sergii]UDD63808.1 hypothetical protein AFCA_011063 [Aspergillus flavus]